MQGEDQPSGAFPNASSVLIRESILNDISGDSHNHYRSSGNTVNNVHANVARDLIVFVDARPPPPTSSQQTPAIPKPPDQFGLPWPSILWRFLSPFWGTAVTLDTPESITADSLPKLQATISISPDPTDSQSLLIQQAPAPEVHPSQVHAQVHREPYPNEGRDNSPQPGDTGSNVVSICTNTFLHAP
jgi:hypothetical protein